MRYLYVTAVAVFLMFGQGLVLGAQETLPDSERREFRDALRLHENGMYSRSGHEFDRIAAKAQSSDPEGFSVLGDLKGKVHGAENRMWDFMARNPQSVLIPQMKWQHAMNRFDVQDYSGAGSVLSQISPDCLYKSQKTEFLFKKAYCDLEVKDLASAEANFMRVEKIPHSDYAAPSRYALGYISYVRKDFRKAIDWFEKSRKDGR